MAQQQRRQRSAVGGLRLAREDQLRADDQGQEQFQRRDIE